MKLGTVSASQRYLSISMAFTLAMILLLVLSVRSPADAQSADFAANRSAAHGKMARDCEEMLGQRQKLMDDMKSQDAELATQLAGMNAAPEERKLEFMAAMLTQMLEEQTAINVRRAAMDEMLMAHMIQHMQMEMDSLTACPVMMGTKEAVEKPAGANEARRDDKKWVFVRISG